MPQPKNRVQVNPLAEPVPLRPRATPVDTFHRPDELPQNQGPNEMQQLNAALSQVAPALFRAGDIQHAEQTQEQMSEGEKAILADKRLQNRKALREAVANGSIPAASNPWFYQGMRQQVYRIEGEKFDQGLREAYAKSDSRNLEDISDFVGGYTQQHMEELGVDSSDPEVARILTPAIERSQSNLLNQHRAERDRAIQQTVEQNTGVEIGMILAHSKDDGVTPQFTAKAIHGLIEEQYKNGLDGTRSNEIAAQAIAEQARSTLDSSLLDLYDEVGSGPDGKSRLGQITWVKELRRTTEEYIHNETFQRDATNSKRNELEKKQNVQDLKAKAFQMLNEDPTSDITQVTGELSKWDADEAEKVAGWKHAALNRREEDDENHDAVDNITFQTYSGNGDKDQIMAARAAGLISGKRSAKLLEDLEKSRDFRSPLRDPLISELHKTLGSTIRGNDVDEKSVRSVNAMRAQNAMVSEIFKYQDDWARTHNGETPSTTDTFKHVREYQQELLRIYAPDASEAAGFVNPKDIVSTAARPDSVDWQHSVIYKPADLQTAVLDYVKHGANSELSQVARQLNIPVETFIMAQKQAAQPRPTKTTK